MAQPYIGEIQMVGFNFAPVGWAFCDGSLMSITQNEALYNLIGTTYGGDGVNTFGLPDLRGRVPIHQFQGPGTSNYVIGQIAGGQTVTMTSGNLPQHTHSVLCDTSGNTANLRTSPSGSFPAAVHPNQFGIYQSASDASHMSNSMLGNGGSASPLPVPIVQPYLCVNFVISLFGVFPSQN